MTDSAKIERITRSLAYMLRHQPERFDLEVDAYGFATLDDTIRALKLRLEEDVDEDELRDAVQSGDRVRYEIQGEKIRALYGHSIPVEPGPPSKPPEMLYVALPTEDVERAQRFGLRGGRRRYLHLALSEEDACDTGRRAARNYTVLSIRALEAWEEGYNFYDRQALWLAESIPTHLLEVQEHFEDGTEPRPHQRRPSAPDDARGGGRGRRSRGGERGGDRGRGRGRGRERDGDRDRDRGRGRDRSPDREREELAPTAAAEGNERRQPEEDGGPRGRSRGRGNGRREGRSEIPRPEAGGARETREPRQPREAREPRQPREARETRQPQRADRPAERPAERSGARPRPAAAARRDDALPFGAGVLEERSRRARAARGASPPPDASPEDREDRGDQGRVSSAGAPPEAPSKKGADDPSSQFGAGL